MTMRRGVLTGGTWCADHNKVVEFWPLENEVVEILSESVAGGGSGCNLAIDLRKLDPAMPVETVGVIGDDEDGRLLLAEADAWGIGREGLLIMPGIRTNYTDAYTSNRTGRRTHIFLQGASAILNPDHFNFGRTKARYLHLGLPGIHRQMDRNWEDDTNGWVTVLRKAQAAGLLTNLELCSIAPDRLQRIVQPCLPYLDLFIVNDFEMSAVAGEPSVAADAADVARVTRMAEAVLRRGAMDLVIAHFPEAAVAVMRDGAPLVVPSVSVPLHKVIGANGAGDAFAAGTLYGLHEGWTLERAIRLGHAAAAASLRSLGTTEAVTSVAACLDLADRWGWRSL